MPYKTYHPPPPVHQHHRYHTTTPGPGKDGWLLSKSNDLGIKFRIPKFEVRKELEGKNHSDLKRGPEIANMVAHEQLITHETHTQQHVPQYRRSKM